MADSDVMTSHPAHLRPCPPSALTAARRLCGSGTDLLVALFVAALLPGCGDSPSNTVGDPCSAGARVCDGQTVLLCSAAISTFVVERECPTGTICSAGECRPSFTGSDELPDTGDASPDLPDAGPGGKPVEDAGATQPHDGGETDGAGMIDGLAPADTDANQDAATMVDTPTPIDAPHVMDTAPLDDATEPDASDAPEVADTQPPDVDQPIDVPVTPDAQPPDPCGNGKLDPGELCDPAIAAGTGACPTSCYDPPGCAILLLQGDAATCNAVCEKVLVSEPIPGDDCCPDGMTAAMDPDCAGECGNGKKDGDEECDGADLGNGTCGTFSPAKPSCLANCTLSTLPCPGTHVLLYEKVKNLKILGDLFRVRWHPSGAFALILAGGGDVIRYDADTDELVVLGNLYGPQDLDVHPSGDYFVIVGADKSKVGHRWRATVAEDLTVTLSDDGVLSNGTPVAVVWSGWNDHWIAGARSEYPYTNWLTLWVDGGPPKLKAWSSGAGLIDLMVGHPSVYFGEPTVITSEGVNGKDSKAYILTEDALLSSGMPASFGNAGAAAWRPGGGYGLVAGWSAGKLYVHTGSAWTMMALPNGIPNGAGPNGIAWKEDGSRALIVGNAIGTSLRAIVVDHRPAGNPAFDSSAFIEQSISGWSNPPYSMTSDADLLAVDWRPGECDEGLIVGSDPATTWNPTFGTIIRFRDQDDPDCE
ncbi:MAG: hypothetical protein AMXMBFR64_25710 [Myxococcales bacterium]